VQVGVIISFYSIFIRAAEKMLSYYREACISPSGIVASATFGLTINLLQGAAIVLRIVCCISMVQVESLMEGPRLQKDLDQERAIIQSLSGL
jgi:hypothetical protein